MAMIIVGLLRIPLKNEAMNFAKQENGTLGRIMQIENGKKFIDWYDFKCLCWSDDV